MDLTIADNNIPLDNLINEALDVYRSIPSNVKINISYSGGKDSTTMAIIACKAIEFGLLDASQLEFIYSNTRIELFNLHKYALNFLNFISKRYGVNTTVVKPPLDKTFWVRFLGEGTIASNALARWCVKPLKIDPIKNYFDEILTEDEEYIVATGIRLDESAVREEKYKDVEKVPQYSCDTQGECFAPLEDEPRAFPILNWKNCNIWDFLQFHDWSYNFPVKELREIYLKQDTARYGCWNCTVVGDGDHVIDAKVLGPDYHELVEWRKLQRQYTFGKKSKYPMDWIYVKREKGNYKGQYTPVRLTVAARKKLLYKLLRIQRNLRRKGHDDIIITNEEVRYIRGWWEKRPDGDTKGREWAYYYELQTSLNDFF